MPIRDYSLQLNTAFFKEMKNILESFNQPNANQSQSQNQSQNENQTTTFCQYLLTKYKECAAETHSPEITCQSEIEILFLTHCVDILKDENLNRSN
jgi:inosine/xanthosine triphosphate pyrophosphatase family protein